MTSTDMHDNPGYSDRIDDEAELLEAELTYIVDRKNLDKTHPVHKVLQNMKKKKESTGNAYLTGICFSGGGIRSAMFSLGIMQCLSKSGILRNMDYLSTVSGGGYIGGALTWWLNPKSEAKPAYDMESNFPFGHSPPDQPDANPARPLEFLRTKGNYLTPGSGHGIASGLSIVLRAIFLNLLVWVPMALLFMLVLFGIGRTPFFKGLENQVNMISPGFLSRISGMIDPTQLEAVDNIFPPVFLLFLVITAIFLVIFLVSSIVFSIMTWLEHGDSKSRPFLNLGMFSDAVEEGNLFVGFFKWIGAFISTMILIGLSAAAFFWVMEILPDAFETPESVNISGRLANRGLLIAAVAVAALAFVITKLTASTTGLRVAVAFKIFLMIVLFVTAVIVDWFLGAYPENNFVSPTNTTYISAVLQITSAIGFLFLILLVNGFVVRWFLVRDSRSLRYGERRLFEQFFGKLLMVSALLLILASIPVVLNYANVRLGGGLSSRVSLAAGVASALWGYYRTSVSGLGGRYTELLLMIGSFLLLYGILATGFDLAVLFYAGTGQTRGGLIALIIFAAGTGYLTNLNYISLNRFYRDRIAEAFMPDFATVTGHNNRAAIGADKLRVGNIWADSSHTPVGPYHLINTNVVLVNDPEPKYAARGGDNYILAPKYSGSSATGWIATNRLANGEITLPSAVATSGAAANPNTGMSGKGATRKPLVSMAMNLLSIRLGYWVPNPRLKERKLLINMTRKSRAQHFYPNALYSLPFFGHKKSSYWLELSDGGHFENNGLYEMIRRRAGLIIVCDGSDDLGSNFTALSNASKRIAEDFGAKIEFGYSLKSRNSDVSDAQNWNIVSRPEDTIPKDTDDCYPPDARYSDRGYFMAKVTYKPDPENGNWGSEGLIIYLKSAMLKCLSPATKSYKGSFPDFPNESTADQFFGPDQSDAYREAGYMSVRQMLNETGLDRMFDNTIGRPPLSDLYNNENWKFRGPEAG